MFLPPLKYKTTLHTLHFWSWRELAGGILTPALEQTAPQKHFESSSCCELSSVCSSSGNRQWYQKSNFTALYRGSISLNILTYGHKKILSPFLSRPLDDMHITLVRLIKDVITTVLGKCVHKIQTAKQNGSSNWHIHWLQNQKING